MATERSFELIKELVVSLIQIIVSITGVQPTRGLLGDVFSHGEITLDNLNQVIVGPGITFEDFKKASLAMTERIAKGFGYEFTEKVLQNIYSNFKDKHIEEARLSELLEFVPDGFLEKEKIKYLSKEELGGRVLERTRELREINLNLEKTVMERTKELVAANTVLEENNKELERLGKAKTEFLSLVSHQLRVPLTAIGWALVDLKDSLASVLSSRNLELIESLLVSNNRMIRLIGNLLNVAQIEEGRLDYEFKKLSVESIVQEIVNSTGPIAKARGIFLKYSPPSDKYFIKADREKLYLAIENIIDNAIKYTPNNKNVEVKINKEGSVTIISVQDEGIGIPKEDQARIFDKFFRAKNVSTDQSSGSGLGLFIVKKIIEDHGGKVFFESSEVRGTTFFIELPFVE